MNQTSYCWSDFRHHLLCWDTPTLNFGLRNQWTAQLCVPITTKIGFAVINNSQSPPQHSWKRGNILTLEASLPAHVQHHIGDISTLHNGHSWMPNGHYQQAEWSWYQLHVSALAMTTTLTSAGILWWTPYHLTQSQWYKVAPSWTWTETWLCVEFVCSRYCCVLERERKRGRK